MTKTPQIFFTGILIFILLVCVYVEYAFAVHGLTLSVLLLAFRRKNLAFFLFLNLIIGGVYDLLYLSPLGSSSLIFHIALIAWMLSSQTSRIRSIIFLLIVLITGGVLAYVHAAAMYIFPTIMITGLVWLIGKQVYTPSENTQRLHIGK